MYHVYCELNFLDITRWTDIQKPKLISMAYLMTFIDINIEVCYASGDII